MSLLSALAASGLLRTLDLDLARALQRLRSDTPDAVAAAAALASLAVAQGHSGFFPAQPQQLLDAALPWPSSAQWLRQLQDSPWVALPGDDVEPARADAPLVLEHGLLSLRRYREYERQLAADLQRLAQPDTRGPAPAALFQALFPGDGDASQAEAARLALAQKLCLISGGPGAGKTTTIVRLLLLLLARADAAGEPPPRIALAAPTGRAADRMAASVRKARGLLQGDPAVDPALLAALPDAASTLHRLLGSIPDRPDFRHHRHNRLPLDVLVVDEASMIDLPLMAKLLDAVADGCRLLLLGDPDQLPSVEAGDVLAAMIAAADAAADATAADDGNDARPNLPHARLRGAWRQSSALQLAPLSEAVRQGDTERALQLLHHGGLDGVHAHPGRHDPLQAPLGDELLQPWRELLAIDDPAQALAAMDRQRLLTALRRGPQGAEELNRRIEQALVGPRHPPYFHGRLLMIIENSYRHGLFNGDTGVCLRDAEGNVLAWFHGPDGQPRAFLPGHLPAHASAWASTVHKAQGSEFERVWLQLPASDARPLTRELIYTALTRARDRLHVLGDDALFAAALQRRVLRLSTLQQRLCTAASAPASADN